MKKEKSVTKSQAPFKSMVNAGFLRQIIKAYRQAYLIDNDSEVEVCVFHSDGSSKTYRGAMVMGGGFHTTDTGVRQRTTLTIHADGDDLRHQVDPSKPLIRTTLPSKMTSAVPSSVCKWLKKVGPKRQAE
jgi:hypothetical protein